MVFEFASTNLDIEFGVVLALLTWRMTGFLFVTFYVAMVAAGLGGHRYCVSIVVMRAVMMARTTSSASWAPSASPFSKSSPSVAIVLVTCATQITAWSRAVA